MKYAEMEKYFTLIVTTEILMTLMAVPAPAPFSQASSVSEETKTLQVSVWMLLGTFY